MIVDPKKPTDEQNSFDERLEKARAKLQKENGEEKNKKDQSLSKGYQMGLEFVSAVAVGGFIGYWLDRWFGTAPIFLIVLVLAGTVTGIRNLMRLLDSTDEDDRP